MATNQEIYDEIRAVCVKHGVTIRATFQDFAFIYDQDGHTVAYGSALGAGNACMVLYPDEQAATPAEQAAA